MAFKVFASFVALATAVQAGLVKRVACPGSTHTAINAACCTWFNVLDDIQANLLDGICGEATHESIRLTFHDAIGFSPALIKQGLFGGGGADGSIILFSEQEQTIPGNLGTEDMADTQKAIADAHGVSYGDIIQFVGAVSLTNCDGGPRLQFKAGRPNATAPVPDGLLPDPTDSVSKILARMADAGFSPRELVALLASHSTAAQDHIDPSVHGSPMDTTFSSFDTQFFIEVQLRGTTFAGATGPNPGEAMSPFSGEVRLLSDHLLARDPATSCFWQSLAANHHAMREEFTEAMAKLAVLGQDVSKLTDCSEVIPLPKAATVQPHIPAGLSNADIEQACATAPFPVLPVAPGPPITSITPVPPQD